MTPREATVVVLTAPRRLEFERQPLKEPAPNELLCETLVTAISPGTELAAYIGLPPLRSGLVYPRVQGYCNVARVRAAGSGIARRNGRPRTQLQISPRPRRDRGSRRGICGSPEWRPREQLVPTVTLWGQCRAEHARGRTSAIVTSLDSADPAAVSYEAPD